MIRELEREKDGDRDREIYMERVSDQECGSVTLTRSLINRDDWLLSISLRGIKYMFFYMYIHC